MKQVTKKLTKSADKWIFGVAGGIANYVNVDPLLIRLMIIALVAAFDGVVLIYLILAVVLPAAQKSLKHIDMFDEDDAEFIYIEKEPAMVSYN